MNHDKINRLRAILEDSGAPEFGDVIIDQICDLFNYPNTNEFVLPKLRGISTAGEATDLAIDWQHWASEQDLSYGELAVFQDFFGRLGDKFNLREEFSENAII